MSHETFKVGEIAIYVRPGSPSFGMECTIVDPLQVRARADGLNNMERVVGPCYRAVFADGKTHNNGNPRWCVRPEWLRKRRPPQDWVKLCNLDHLPTRLQGEVA